MQFAVTVSEGGRWSLPEHIGALAKVRIDSGLHVARVGRRGAIREMTASAGTPTVPPGKGYWQRSRGPMAALALVGPILVLHGVLLLGWPSLAEPAPAEAWLRWALVQLGFGSAWLLPALVAVTLSVWQVLRGGAWPTWRVAGMMLSESAVLATAMWCLAGALEMVLGPGNGRPADGACWAPLGDAMSRAELVWLASPGRGVYEEVLFRLMLLPLVVVVARRMQLSLRTGWLLGVLGTSLMYGVWAGPLPLDEVVGWWRMGGRVLTGLWFAWLFQRRGFGIAAGTHAWYELLAG